MLKTTKRVLIIFSLIFFIRVAAFSQGTAGGGVVLIEIEQGSSKTFVAASVNASSYQWFKNDSPIAGATMSTLVVSEAGVYTVVAFNNGNCSSIMSDGYRVIIKPKASSLADLTIAKKSDNTNVSINKPYEYLITVKNNGPDAANQVIVKDVLPEGLVFKNVTMALPGQFNYNIADRTLTWSINKLEKSENSELRFIAEAINPGTVINTATVRAIETDLNLDDNTSTDVKSIIDIIIPNVFTPNGDGVNDHFEIKNLEMYAENEMSIINRWGNSVYEKKDYQNNWDGNGLDEGTYFFVLKVKNAVGTWKAFKGYITLLRSNTTL